jgi:hypothetical protein
LNQKYCDCTDFNEYQSPCSHAIAAAKFLRIDSIELFDQYFTTQTYESTYRHTVLPVSIENLPRDDSIKPPILRKAAGRPRTKRVRKGQWSRKQTRCGNCLEWGHNRRRCTNQPVSNGRRERAYEWLQSESEDEDSREEEEDQLSTDEEEESRLDQELGIQIEEVDQAIELETSDSSDNLSEVDSDIFDQDSIQPTDLALRFSTRSGKAYGI